MRAGSGHGVRTAAPVAEGLQREDGDLRQVLSLSATTAFRGEVAVGPSSSVGRGADRNPQAAAFRGILAAVVLPGAFAGPAYAQSGPPAANPIWIQMIPFVLIILIFYFLILRPQQKRQKALQKMIEGLRKGDRVVTGGGIYGTIFSIKDDTVLVEVSKEVRIEFAKSAITAVVPGGGE